MKPHKLTRRYLLTQVKKLILSEPKRIRMEVVIDRVIGKLSPSCGTVGCIAGWTCAVAKMKANNLNLKQAVDSPTWFSTSHAAKLLRLNNTQRINLFYLEDWPMHLQAFYLDAKTPLARARVTCKRIDLFLKSGGRK